MSFILDALRKSEHDRQRQGGPGIADLKPVAVAGRLPVWAIALGVLLLINIAVVLVLVLRGEPAPNNDQTAVPTQSTTGAAPPANTAPSGAAPPPPTRQAAAAYALPPPVLPPVRAPGEGVREPVYESSEPQYDAPLRADPELNQAMRSITAPERTANAENLPSLNDVMLQGSGRVPELHLDIHVYSARPADRFVFLNSRKYREGGETPEGTRIERITADGVVLNHRGLRFLMPRQ